MSEEEELKNLTEPALKLLEYIQVAYDEKNRDYEKYSFITPGTIELITNTPEVQIQKNNIYVIYSSEADASEREYRSAIFIDSDKKEVVVANAGTRLGLTIQGFYDLADDVNLMNNKQPGKVKQAIRVNKIIIELLSNHNSHIKDYKIIYTGHSLGAAIADMQAAYMEIELQKQGITDKGIQSITFENPGSGKFVDTIYEEGSGARQASFIAINGRDNFINTLGPQAGKTYKIPTKGTRQLTNTEIFFYGVIHYLYECISKFKPEWTSHIYCKLIKVFSFGPIDVQIEEHKLEPFEKYFKNISSPKQTSEGYKKYNQNININKKIKKEALEKEDLQKHSIKINLEEEMSDLGTGPETLKQTKKIIHKTNSY